jgi:phosphohistidine swiveling domain-containing protein
MVPRVLELDDPAACDAAVVGAKAAGLARASAAGLPVLPGVVVPVGESDVVVRAAADAMGEGSDVRARMAVMKVQPDPQLIAELRDRLAGFSAPLIVRSSSPLEADGTWSGAFSSFHGISADDLATAVRGCWGSAFSVGVLVRARETGTPPDRLGLAVLVQPELHPDVGGTARLKGDGSVVITSTHGPLLPLMEGHVEGAVSRVAPDGSVTTADGIDDRLVVEVAGLLRQVNKVLDHHLIEWAAVKGRVHLLQSLRSEEKPLEAADAGGDLDPALSCPVSLRVARLVQRFPGRLGYDLVLPWAVCFASALPAPVRSDLEPFAALAAAQAEASALTAQLWGRSPRAAAAEAERILRKLRGPAPAEAVAVLEGLPQPSDERAAVVLGHLEAVGRALRSRGVVDKDADFWRLTPEGLQRALLEGRAEAAGRFGVDQWEPFVHRVVTATGTAYDGTSVVPGAGAGRAHVVGDRVAGTPPQGRYVIVAGQPLPGLAPLLWSAAGLVTRAGATGAHLLEFAHSIGVPTVVGCDLPPMDSATPALIAVDGDRGSVSVVAYGDD